MPRLRRKRFTGAADYYTKDEYDATIDAIQAEATASGIWLALDSVQYEEDTGLTHFEWVWEVYDDGNVQDGGA